LKDVNNLVEGNEEHFDMNKERILLQELAIELVKLDATLETTLRGIHDVPKIHEGPTV